jgi:hypothetical protein
MIHSRYAVGVDASIRPYNAVCRIISAFRCFAHIHPALGVAHSFQFRQPLLSRYFFAFSSDIIRPSILQKILSLFPLYRLLPQMKSRPPKKSGDLHFYRLSL